MKLEHIVIFVNYTASIVLLIFPAKTLIWNKMVLPASNSLHVLDMVENELEKTLSKSIERFIEA